jgi:hypothetical protein
MCYTPYAPYTIDYSYLELHSVKYEQTDVVQVQLHAAG